MRIIQIGLTHQTAPIEVREKLALSEAAVPIALETLCPDSGSDPCHALAGAILSTCNRLEVYAVVECADWGQQDIQDFLARVSGVPRAILEPHLQVCQGKAAVMHLCEVACGLDSMSLGESQIQGQVARAHQLALARGAAGAVLDALFRTALQAGKRARAETDINKHAASISHVAVELASKVFDDLAHKRALLIGAGEMAELAAKNLVAHGIGNLVVINRSLDRAVELARQFGGETLDWERLTRALWGADIVISSTAAPHVVLDPDTVATAMCMRRDRPLFIIDIAVPRDVDAAVGDLPNVFLYDVDDLGRVVDANLEQRRREIPRVQAIIQAEVTDFMAWFRALDVVPTIVDLRQQMERIRETELERAMRQLDHLSDHERNVILNLSQRIVNKILHQPMVRLKQHANDCEAHRYAEVLRDLFGLSVERAGMDKEWSCGQEFPKRAPAIF